MTPTSPRRGHAGPALLLALGMIVAGGSRADFEIDTERHRVLVRELASGLEHPWSIAFLPDGRWLVTERPGRLRLVVDGKLRAEPLGGLPDIAAQGQGGLLDVVPHPAFAENGLVYLSYAGGKRGRYGTEVVRGRLGATGLEDVERIFRAEPKQGGGRHFGSRLVFGDDGLLYVSLGDRGDRPTGQDLGQHAGSIVRIADDGTVPPSNPFVGRPGVLPEIYSYGHRNVQGMTLDRASGRLWAHEHGPQGGDELNLVRAGVNYGWPVITYGANYVTGSKIGEGTDKDGMAQPRTYWVPSIAPSGLAFYDGERFAGWRGNLLVGALKFQLLARIELDGERVVHEERFLSGRIGRIRDVRTGPDGYVYLLTDASDGKLYRLEPLD